MQKMARILCAALALLAVGVLGTLQECFLSENPRQEKFILDESSWELMLQGEWMVNFCSPMIMDCIKFERVWNKFAMEKRTEGGDMVIASMKLEYSETLIRRFSLHDLPTLLHVKDGVFRKLPIVYTVDQLKQLAAGKWQDTEPMPFWQHPNGPLIHAYIQYIRTTETVYQSDWLDADYEHATWLVRTVIALIVAMVLTVVSSIYSFIRDRCSGRRLANCQKNPQIEGQPIQEIDLLQPALEATADSSHSLSI